VVPWQGQNDIDTDWWAETWDLLHDESYYSYKICGSQTLEETAAQLTANVSYIYRQLGWRCMVMSSVGEPRTEGLRAMSNSMLRKL
jgi:hypothetical protein